MKRVITAATFYAVDPSSPYNTVATFPGFTIDEAVDCMEKDKLISRGYVPLTSTEYNNFMKAVKKNRESECIDVYDSMKDKFMYSKYSADPEGFKQTLSYSFWYTGAYSLRDTVIAYGADYAGNYEFNLSRIAKRVGERAFYEFSAMKGKRLKSYAQLQNALKELGVDVSGMPSEGKMKEACDEGTYFKARM